MRKFINLSNHPSIAWAKAQLSAAEVYGPVCDLDFPQIDAEAAEDEIIMLANSYAEKIIGFQPAAVMIQGEFTFTYALVSRLKEQGITCLSACSKRVAKERILENGAVEKTSEFQFVKFREYK